MVSLYGLEGLGFRVQGLTLNPKIGPGVQGLGHELRLAW